MASSPFTPKNSWWEGCLEGEHVELNVVGTYGDINKPSPVCRVSGGQYDGQAVAVDWDNGKVLKVLNLV